MNRRTGPWLLSLFVTILLALAVTRQADAAPNDKEAEELVQGVLASEYAGGQFKEALEKLALAEQACEGKACSPRVRAKVYVAIGTVLAGGTKDLNKAKQAFANALKEDPNATLFAEHTTPDVEKAFNEARLGSPPESSPPPKPGTARPKRVCPKGGRAPKGWRSAEAYCYFRQALEAEAARDWSECALNAQASLGAENRPTTRMLSGTCQERGGLWLEALAEYQIVAQTASDPRIGLFETANEAKTRAQQLREKIPKLVIRKPAKAERLVVKMNGVDVPPNKLGGEIWVNPGQRTITATGKVGGVPLKFEEVVEATEFETTTIDIKPGPKGEVKRDSAIMKCMLEAKTRDDFAKCIKSGGSGTGLNFRVTSELSAYHDSDHVDVLTPAVSVNAESPTQGWGVGASFLVDVVTAASVDIVASASPRWTEVRWVPGMSAHKKISDFDVSAHASLSHEPDYLAVGAGLGVSLDLLQKTVTPSLGYDFGYDISGRAGTPFDVFSREITRHALDAAMTFIIDKSTFFAASFTAVFEDGDTSKPYRYIPLFNPALADGNPQNNEVSPGQTVDSVNLAREPERVLEQLPTDRQRWAVAGRIAHRYTASTLRAEERIYIDSWGLKATTTDAKYIVDVSKSFRLWPHLRFHAQTGVDFWELAYVSRRSAAGLVVPALRTGDRELGPLIAVTLGGGARLALGSDWALTATADVIYSRFLDHLYILQRFGYFGALGLEAEFE